MKCSFLADVQCLLTFTDEQWDFIIMAFKTHYDRVLNIDVKVGGWLYGLNNQRMLALASKEKPNANEIELLFTFRQVDKVIKSLETHVQFSESKIAKEIDVLLRKVITMIYAASTAAQSVLKLLTIDNV